MEALTAIAALRERLGYERSEDAHCETHGPYVVDVYRRKGGEFLSPCPKCIAEGQQSELAAVNERNRVESDRVVMNKALERAAIPERFHNKKLSNYEAKTPEQRRVLAACREYAARFDEVMAEGRSMILCGTQGTGKNHLSIGIAHEIMDRGRAALYATVSTAVRRIRATWGSKHENEREALKLFVKPDLLILDEIGVQSGTDNEYTIIFDIMNGRYEANKPTIVTSNLPIRDVKDESGSVTIKGLESVLGSRLLDRLRENGGKAFLLNWESYRSRE